jgi:hypothetical protein
MPNFFLWLPALAVAAHLIEEFVWPGRFMTWYRQYPTGYTTEVSTRFVVIINLVLVALALLPPLLGPTPRGFAIWIVVACVGAANAVFHIIAVMRTRQYSPGVVTGVVAYLPLAIIGGAYLWRSGRIATGTLVQAVVIGIAYHVWSAWNHSRHSHPDVARAQ